MNSAKPSHLEAIPARPEPLRNTRLANGNAVRLLAHGGRQAESYARAHALARLAAPKKVRFLPEAIEALARFLDVFVIFATAKLAALGYLEFLLNVEHVGDQYFMATLIAATCFGFLMQSADAYALNRLTALRWQAKRVLCIWIGVIACLLALAFFSNTTQTYARVWALGWIVLTPVLLLTGRLALSMVVIRCREGGQLLRNVAIVGANNIGRSVIDKLQGQPHDRVHLVGIFDDRRVRVPGSIGGHDVLGTTDDLVRMARQVPIDQIIVALPPVAAGRLQAVFRKLGVLPVDLRLSVESLVEAFPIKGVVTLGSATLLEVAEQPLKRWCGVLKWLEDKIVATVALVLVGPVMAVIALLIKLDSRGPVLFVQDRFGYNNSVIRVLKFRTMHTQSHDASGGRRTVRNDRRVTRLGRYLREWSLDELPQIFNVLMGEMSIVGPRPHALAMKAGDRLYHEAVSEYAWRHRIKPGITGWAQVSGLRGEIDSLEKARSRVKYDMYYIDNWSLIFDFYIMLKSVRVVLGTEGAY